MFLNVCESVRVCLSLCLSVYVCVYVSVCLYVFLYVCVCVWVFLFAWQKKKISKNNYFGWESNHVLRHDSWRPTPLCHPRDIPREIFIDLYRPTFVGTLLRTVQVCEMFLNVCEGLFACVSLYLKVCVYVSVCVFVVSVPVCGAFCVLDKKWRFRKIITSTGYRTTSYGTTAGVPTHCAIPGTSHRKSL